LPALLSLHPITQKVQFFVTQPSLSADKNMFLFCFYNI